MRVVQALSKFYFRVVWGGLADGAGMESAAGKGDHPFDHLMVMRGFFCLAVVEGHCYDTLPPEEKAGLARQLQWHGFRFDFLWQGTAPAAVWGFFLLSGYLIGKGFFGGRYPFTAHGVFLFYGNRLKRILPLYYFVVLTVGLFGMREIGTHGVVPLLPVMLFSANLYGPFGFLNLGHLWSLSTEMQFYLLAPLLGWAVIKVCRRPARAPFLMVLLIGVSLLWRGRFCGSTRLSLDHWFAWYDFPLRCNLEFFLAGFLATPAIRWLRERSSWGGGFSHPHGVRWGAYGLFFFGLGMSAFVMRAWKEGSVWGYEAFMVWLPGAMISVTVVALVLFELCTHSSPPRSKPLPAQLALVGRQPARIFEVFGILTYGIYMWHLPILMEIAPHLSAGVPLLHFGLVFGTVLGAATLVAAITYHFIEYPFDAKKKLK